MGQNLVEKIAQRFAVGLGGHAVRSGDYISVRPAHILTHDNTGAVLKKFREIGAKKMADPSQPVFALDHNIQDRSEANLKKYRAIEEFAREMGVDFHPAGRGIGHQVMCEEGYVWPDTMVVASDSHSNMYGGLGCLGTPVVRTDAAAIWATGRTWWQVPPVARVELLGKLRPGVSGKDVILSLCGFFREDEVLNCALEFAGQGASGLEIEERLTIANMTTEWGALAGVFPADEKTFEWIQGRIRSAGNDRKHPRWREDRLESVRKSLLRADDDAFYARGIRLDLDTVRPCIAGPDDVKVTHDARELCGQGIRIDKAYLVSCVNARAGDLAQAAAVVRGRRIVPGVVFYVAAASLEVQRESERRGDWGALVDAGATVLPPGCGPCIGLGDGLLADGEVGISATNRNFKGRMGSREARVYLASPAVVAASALAGKIAMPEDLGEAEIRAEFRVAPKAAVEAAEVEIAPGFPERIEGRLLFCHQDNLNTDGIYPGKYTYNDDFTPEQQARAAMENYDPGFQGLAREGDMLAGGYNFGTGSSREQAATALKYRGVRLVIAGSFSETYKRNAINNGFLVVDSPDLIDELKRRYGADRPTVATDRTLRVDFRKSLAFLDSKSYPIGPVGMAAQELILAGGLENWVRQRI